MAEKLHEQQSPEQQATPEQRREDERRAERLREDAERRAEQAGDDQPERLEKSRHEVERVAEKQEKPAVEASAERAETRPDVASKRERAAAYDEHMDTARSHMKPAGRAFSKVIHNRAVESVSEATGKTVARPNAILAGSFTAFVVVLGVFLVARYYGYPLSGSETIIAFAGGWVVGVLFDYLRVMVTGRHQ